MAFGILGATPGCDIDVDDPAAANVSFPGFWELLASTSGGNRSFFRGGRRVTVADSGCLVVAIDGPAASGKSTTAKELARELGLRHLDSGLLYRCVTLALLDSALDITDAEGITASAVRGLKVAMEWGAGRMELYLSGRRVVEEALRQPRITSLVSQSARFPEVRAHLLEMQRSAARGPGLVADGRDIGTVVFPRADVKVFLVADAEERARRRLVQDGMANPSPSQVAAEAARLLERDRRDSSRTLAPLRPAPDAVRLDTTGLCPEEQVRRDRRAREQNASATAGVVSGRQQPRSGRCAVLSPHGQYSFCFLFQKLIYSITSHDPLTWRLESQRGLQALSPRPFCHSPANLSPGYRRDARRDFCAIQPRLPPRNEPRPEKCQGASAVQLTRPTKK